MPRTQIEFDQANDTEFASQYELDGVKDNNRSPSLFVQSTMNNYDLWLRTLNIGSRANDSNWIFFDPAGKAYIEFNYASYTDVAYYIFRGTSVWTPVSMLVRCGRSSSNGRSYIRILDVDSGLVISVLSYTSATNALRSADVIQANLPSGLASFALQCYNTGTGKTRIFAASMYPAS